MKRPDILDYKDRNDYFDDLERYIDFLENKMGGGAEGQLETNVIEKLPLLNNDELTNVYNNLTDIMETRKLISL